ncbi:unnamed protein product [Gongylonema pulchrum]|uniref:Uncharacterized protein n=1 Tax=Gongylonema pulchrum TaxID=637853 RepID=A0A3P7MVQ8_9BILA|nr:unnamed protein product [Gongylonema pulchrum]
MAPTALALPDGPQRQRYGAVAKLLAACLFDSDEYTKAVVCLAHVVRLLENDTHSRLLLTCWLCFLGHWSLARMQLNRRMKEKKPVTAHSAVIDGAIDCAIKLHTSNTEIGDPLFNMEAMKARYETLVKCRSSVFYEDENILESENFKALERVPFSKEGTLNDSKIDEYLKLNAVVAEHFILTAQFALKYIEKGILRESENETLRLLQQMFKAASMQRYLLNFS